MSQGQIGFYGMLWYFYCLRLGNSLLACNNQESKLPKISFMLHLIWSHATHYTRKTTPWLIVIVVQVIKINSKKSIKNWQKMKHHKFLISVSVPLFWFLQKFLTIIIFFLLFNKRRSQNNNRNCSYVVVAITVIFLFFVVFCF